MFSGFKMLPQETIKKLEIRLNTLLDDCDVIDASLVSTMDGHLCAVKQRSNMAVERLAIMGSSLIALGDAITEELKMGTCDKIISENQNGIVAFMHIDEDLVLVTVTTNKNGLGMLLSHARRCAKEMLDLL